MSARLVLPAMGTMISIATGARAEHPVAEGSAVDLDALAPTLAALVEGWEQEFSLYRPDSAASLLAGGALRLADAPERTREVYAEALARSSRTGGAFTPHRPDGVIDLAGIVKALVIDALDGALHASGSRSHAISVGGDVLASGAGWGIGIVDPDDRTTLLGRLESVGERTAVATSGSAERGDHIWRLGAAPPAFAQVTVRGTDIVTADVLATAIVAGGHEALDDLVARFGVEVLAVRRDGGLLATPGMRVVESGAAGAVAEGPAAGAVA